MLAAAENINVLSKNIGAAIKAQDKKPIQDLAKRLDEAGSDILDLNAGPARKGGPEMMEWLVKTVQEVSKLPLQLDTTNIDAIEAGLKVYDTGASRPIINSTSMRPERLDALLPMAKDHDAEIIALMLGVDGIPRDANERGALLAECLFRTGDVGLKEEDVYIDPIVLPVSSQQQQLLACTEFMEMLPEIAPNVKTTGGISNVSNGVPDNLRPILNQTYTAMLLKFGLYSGIIDGLDPVMLDICHGKRDDIVGLIHKVMDGKEIDDSSLSKEELDYVKTTRVLMGQSLFSESWLEI
jgi:5-methyltetrahydrofolate corrinoid/iron sulfur protein methyltransferase